jgi:hypothetical protein
MGSRHSTTRRTRALSPRLSPAIPSLRPESSAGLLTLKKERGQWCNLLPLRTIGSGAERKSVFVGWHAARRGLRSNLYPLGVPDMVIQRILRGANVSTSLPYYIKTAADDVRKAMMTLENSVTGQDRCHRTLRERRKANRLPILPPYGKPK